MLKFAKVLFNVLITFLVALLPIKKADLSLRPVLLKYDNTSTFYEVSVSPPINVYLKKPIKNIALS